MKARREDEKQKPVSPMSLNINTEGEKIRGLKDEDTQKEDNKFMDEQGVTWWGPSAKTEAREAMPKHPNKRWADEEDSDAEDDEINVSKKDDKGGYEIRKSKNNQTARERTPEPKSRESPEKREKKISKCTILRLTLPGQDPGTQGPGGPKDPRMWLVLPGMSRKRKSEAALTSRHNLFLGSC